MRSQHILSATLALLVTVPVLAQTRTTKQGVIVYEPTVTLASLDEVNLADRLKDPKAGIRDVDFGGQFRMRYHHERNMRTTPGIANRRGLTGAHDDFLLYRTRLWMDATVNQRLHVYFELLDAESTLENLPPRGNEVDRLDLHQAYADVTVNERLQARVGRQSLDIGSTRFIGMGEWANTRRAFDGVQVFLAGDNFDFDAYYLHPLSVRPHDLNQTNLDARVYGLNTHQHVEEGTILDYYWLAYELDNRGARYDTLGIQWKGERGDLLYELEGAVQTGTNPDTTDHSAGFGVVGLGTRLEGRLAGQFWVYYEWASGSDSTGNGFHHYTPRAHRHLGYMDLFGRRNINDLNLRWTYQPSDTFELRVWYHYFSLANGGDVPYNTNMTPFAGLGPGTSGSRSLGHELDLLATLQLSERLKFQLGYSHFFAGDYYRTTPGVPTTDDADFFYTQMSLEF